MKAQTLLYQVLIFKLAAQILLADQYFVCSHMSRTQQKRFVEAEVPRIAIVDALLEQGVHHNQFFFLLHLVEGSYSVTILQ